MRLGSILWGATVVSAKKYSVPIFPDWVPEAVRLMAAKLWREHSKEKDPANARQFLERLIINPTMKRVWDELYKKRRIEHKATDEYLYPACVTNASAAVRNRRRALELRKKGGSVNEREADDLEAEAALYERENGQPADPISEQDRAAQLLFRDAYQSALKPQPIFAHDLRSNIRKLGDVAKQLREISSVLSSLKLADEARELKTIAEACDDQATDVLKTLRAHEQEGDDPWIITRNTGDIELRAFVADMVITTTNLFETELHGTIANIANAVFGRSDITGSTVREMLRVPASHDAC